MAGTGKIIQATEALFPLGNETEIRFGRIICGSFSAGLSFLQFAKLLEHIKAEHEPEHIYQMDFVKDKRRLSVHFENQVVAKEEYISKGKRNKQDFQGAGLPVDIRVCSMTETMIPFSDAVRHEMRDSPDLIREKDRARFHFDGFQIDMTVVNTTKGKAKAPEGDKETPSTTFEVEIEIQNKDSIDEAVSWVTRIIKILGEPLPPKAEFRNVP